ncbi:MAG TPA: Na+/H+ antiporter [Solirubrobacteraceae bacterium]|nr:Na+/H+ antiporter [Solirubrobacteraceae bacterium]
MIDASLVIALLAAITLLAGLAARTGTPYPVVLVLGGLVMGLAPGIPSPRLNPDLVLVLFLPPLLYSSAFLSSVGELRANARPILLLAVGLVLATVGGLAVVGVLVAGLPWAVAFVLGAVLGPTDPVSASAILQRLGAPARIVTILEGESLVNDATAITAFTIALAAVGSGVFSPLDAIGKFVFEVVVGTVIGLIAAWLATLLRRRLQTDAELALTLLTPFIAYIPADEIGASGVLAAVAAGLYAATRETETTSAHSRLRIRAFWDVLVFLLNALLFLLVGEQLPHIVQGIGGGFTVTLVGQVVAVAAAIFALRLVWMFALSPVARALRRGRTGTPAQPAARFVLGWSAMRGGVTLALALAIPLQVEGRAFPHRSLVIFLAYGAVLITLVVPGLTLGPLIRRLGLQQGAARQRLLAQAQAAILHAALEEIEALASDDRISEGAAERISAPYHARLDRLVPRRDGEDDRSSESDQIDGARRAVIAAQRRRVSELRRDNHYPAEMLREIERDLDLDEARLR